MWFIPQPFLVFIYFFLLLKNNKLQKKIGLLIDLTNTDRFYDAESEVKQQGIRYVKINCKGHGETPTQENTQLFLKIVENFIRQNPTSLIGVHCTHGFNRSGFLICSYLVEKLDYSIGIMLFQLYCQIQNSICLYHRLLMKKLLWTNIFCISGILSALTHTWFRKVERLNSVKIIFKWFKKV